MSSRAVQLLLAPVDILGRFVFTVDDWTSFVARNSGEAALVCLFWVIDRRAFQDGFLTVLAEDGIKQCALTFISLSCKLYCFPERLRDLSGWIVWIADLIWNRSEFYS